MTVSVQASVKQNDPCPYWDAPSEGLCYRSEAVVMPVRWIVAKQGDHSVCVDVGHPEAVATARYSGRFHSNLNTVDIRVLDHFVVGLEGWVSFAEKGWI